MWGELCDWYLELIKPRLNDPEDPTARAARQILAHCFDLTLRLLHPFVPYITEYLYQELNQQVPERGVSSLNEDETSSSKLLTCSWPRPREALDDPDLLRTFSGIQTVTRGIREVRSTRGVSPRQPLTVTLRSTPDRSKELEAHTHIIKRLAYVSELIVDPKAAPPPGSVSRVAEDFQIYVHDVVDIEQERARLKKEMVRLEKEINTCSKKLDNEKFVSRAPTEVIQEQRDRLSKYKTQMEAVRRSLAELG